MGEGEPDVGHNSPRDSSMTIRVLSGKGGHGTSLFCFIVILVYLVAWANYSERYNKVVIARTPHLMRGTWQSHKIASLRSQ